jgi:hypothetical protein
MRKSSNDLDILVVAYLQPIPGCGAAACLLGALHELAGGGNGRLTGARRHVSPWNIRAVRKESFSGA